MDIEYRAYSRKADTYAYIREMLEKILAETDDQAAGLANASSLLMLQLEELNWAGFYLMKDGGLVLRPFQGKPAVVHIPVGAGVCGTAVKEGRTQLVKDVHCCENHIACDINSRSEIVVPLIRDGVILGVLDIDSPVKARFDEEDQAGLEQAAERIAAWMAAAQDRHGEEIASDKKEENQREKTEHLEEPDIHSEEPDMLPEERVVERLKEKGWHISFAESCTGGLAAGRLVNVASASSVFDGSFVTYANEAKTDLLGVSPETIAEVGVVSEEVAAQMAAGTAKRMGAEVGVGITGVAGPTGGTPRKPVGMVCFGFFLNGETHTCTRQFGDIGRNEVRKASVDFIYEKLADLL